MQIRIDRPLARAAAAVAAAALLAAAPASAQNLLANPSFDTDVSGWNLAIFDASTITWDPMDHQGSPGSGSARILKMPTVPNTARLEQCVPAVAGQSYDASVWLFLPTQAAAGLGFLALDWYGTSNCGDFIENGPSANLTQPLDTWFQATVEGAVAPPGTNGLIVLTGAQIFASEVPFEMFVDEVFVPEPGPGAAGAAALLSLSAMARLRRRPRERGDRLRGSGGWERLLP